MCAIQHKMLQGLYFASYHKNYYNYDINENELHKSLKIDAYFTTICHNPFKAMPI